MELDHHRCYEALRSRDRRFDGRFWVGVRTTGVYCRPVCPSRTPLSRNVDFFGHPAAAEDAGFRPCLRCRPETAPGTAGWRGGEATVERALRLVDEGALDGASVADLARRLHVGERHLRRLFAEHVGASPDAVARSRRAHLARRLLTETDATVADVAFAAGFGSVRQCNAVIKATFAATPSALRAAGSAPAGSGGTLSMRLAACPPFDGTALLDWFAVRAVDGVEEVDGAAYRRVVRVGDRSVHVTITPGADHVVLALDQTAGVRLGGFVAPARRLFDLAADPAAVAAHLATDPLLAPSVSADPGVRVPGCWSGFEAAVRAVVGQQISVRGAVTVLGRLAASHGRGAFPEPEDLVDAPMEGVGLIGRRVDTIRHVAAAVLDGRLVLDGSVEHRDLVESLVSIPGIGPWSAEYVALRLGEPDAFPAGDLHLLRLLGTTSESAARARAEQWRPWRAYGAAHLWNRPRPQEVA